MRHLHVEAEMRCEDENSLCVVFDGDTFPDSISAAQPKRNPQVMKRKDVVVE